MFYLKIEALMQHLNILKRYTNYYKNLKWLNQIIKIMILNILFGVIHYFI